MPAAPEIVTRAEQAYVAVRARVTMAGRTQAANDSPEVTELRLVVSAPDHEQALRFCRDVLGLPPAGGQDRRLSPAGSPSARSSAGPAAACP